MNYYFAYGGHMDAVQMAKVTPDAVAVGPARLAGYRLEFNLRSREWMGGAANAVADPDGSLHGVLWEVGDDVFASIDSYAGDDPGFDRPIEVVVEGPDGAVTARTYVVESHAGYVRPTDPYLRHLREAAAAQGLPQEALDELDRADRFPQAPTPTI